MTPDDLPEDEAAEAAQRALQAYLRLKHLGEPVARQAAMKAAWNEALRLAREHGCYTRPLGSLLKMMALRGIVGGKPLPPEVVGVLEELGRLLAPSDWRLEPKLVTEAISPDEERVLRGHAHIISAMVKALDGKTTIQGAVPDIANELGVSESTVQHVWARARNEGLVLPEDVPNKRRKATTKRKSKST
jgi:hypothetical protein